MNTPYHNITSSPTTSSYSCHTGRYASSWTHHITILHHLPPHHHIPVIQGDMHHDQWSHHNTILHHLPPHHHIPVIQGDMHHDHTIITILHWYLDTLIPYIRNMESRWLLFPVLTAIYNLSVNHGILYCLCRHKRSSLDLKQFRVSLMITFSGREFQSPTILWLKKEPRTSSLKHFLWIFWLWPLSSPTTSEGGWWIYSPALGDIFLTYQCYLFW